MAHSSIIRTILMQIIHAWWHRHSATLSDGDDEHFHRLMSDAVDNPHPLSVHVHLAAASEIETVLVAKLLAELRTAGKFCNLLEDETLDAPLKFMKFVRCLWMKEDLIVHLPRFPRPQGCPRKECTRSPGRLPAR